MQQTFFARDLGHAAHRISADELAGDESLQRSLRAFERAMGGNDPQRAETILRKAVEERPAASLGWGNLGGMLLQQKRVTEALPLLQRAFQLDRSQFEVTLNLARAHALTNNVGEALQYARLAVELRPGHPNALAMMVGILFQADRGNDAEPFLETLRQVDPKNLCRPELLLAALWESRGRRREAAELVISYADRHAGQPDATPLRERALRMLDDGRQTLADARH
jgi:tetratricopeptide (TPR) repeat protein